MDSLNKIGIGVSGAGYTPVKPEGEKKEEQPVVNSESPKTEVSANDVLNFMAAQSAPMIPTKPDVDPAKYVDDESSKRIAGFMSDFENIVAENLSAIMAEFPDMSPAAAELAALNMIN